MESKAASQERPQIKREFATEQKCAFILKEEDRNLKYDYTYKALIQAEQQHGRPVNLLEILAELKKVNEAAQIKLPDSFVWKAGKLAAYVYDLYRNDEILADRCLNWFSADLRHQNTKANPTNFNSCSDRIEIDFKDYQMDGIYRMRPGKDTPTVSFPWLKELLLSKDLARCAELDWIKDGYRFLDGKTDISGDAVALQSYPRCGNTFFRRTFEDITGVISGSDMSIKHCYSEVFMGLLGTHVVSSTNFVWMTKTHFPLKVYFDEEDFDAPKQIAIMRNPLDVIPSFASLYISKSHDFVLENKLDQEFPEFWDAFIDFTVKNMEISQKFAIEKIAAAIPTYVVRYEDLKLRRAEVMKEVLAFLLGVPSIEGTVVEKRIEEVCNAGFAAQEVYKLKSTSMNLSRNEHMYKPEQLERIKAILSDYNHFCGYAQKEGEAKGETHFFKYSVEQSAKYDSPSESLWTQRNGYLTLNQRTLSQLGCSGQETQAYPFGKEDVKGNKPPAFDDVEALKVKGQPEIQLK